MLRGADVVPVSDHGLPDSEVTAREIDDDSRDIDSGNDRIFAYDATFRSDRQSVLEVDGRILHSDGDNARSVGVRR